MPARCPECDRYFPSSKGLGPHLRQAHGVKKATKLKTKPRKQVEEINQWPTWDEVADRPITPCRECGGHRMAIQVNSEGTTLVCDNWQCWVYRQPKDYAKVVRFRSIMRSEPE